MANKTAIVQAALARLGEEVPDNIALDTDPLNAADAIYDSIANSFLCKHGWSFATRWRAIDATSNTPPEPWTYEYAVPVECINIRDVYDQASGATADYEPVGSVIYANRSGPLTLLYTWRPSEEVWPGDFCDAVEEELLGRLLGAFEERTRSLEIREVADKLLTKAMRRDRRQRPPMRVNQPPLLRSWFRLSPRRM